MAQGKVEEKESAGIEAKIDEMLMTERKICLFSQVDDKSAKDIIRKLWYLEHLNPGKPILFVINSPGGSVDSGFAIWDQCKMITSPIYTMVTGLAASMGSILSLVAGNGRRFATKNSRIMIHQPLIGGVIQGQATDLEIQAKEIIKTRESLIEIYRSETGKQKVEIEKALDRDTWMSADEAVEFGLLDGVVNSYKDIDMS